MFLNIFLKNKIIYRDKSDVPKLPGIPDKLLTKFDDLIDQTNHCGNEPLYVLKKIYDFMDKYNKFVASFSVCKKGCSHCCNINVDISALEAEYIIQNTHTLPNTIPLNYKKNKSSCPFLGKKGQCTIYKYRPFNCRTFHTLDNPKYCETGEDHMTYGSSSVNYGSDILVNIYQTIRTLNDIHDIRDIRSFFGEDN